MAASFFPPTTAQAGLRSSTGLTNTYVCALAVSGTNLFAGTWWRRLSFHQQRHKLDCGQYRLDESLMSMSLAVSGTNLFAGTDGGGVFLSTNNGTSWTAVNTGLTNTDV